MRKCLREHTCMSFTFAMAILNGTCFFRSPGIDFVFLGECICVLGLEYKYFLVDTIVRRGVRVEVCVEIHVESFCAETPDCELQRRQEAIYFLL